MKGGSGRRRYEKYTEPLSNEGSSIRIFDACDSIEFKTILQKVQAAISAVSAGDELGISLAGNSLNVVDKLSGTLYGNIVTAKNPELIACIKKGNKYHALVLSISGKTCKVKVEKDPK